MSPLIIEILKNSIYEKYYKNYWFKAGMKYKIKLSKINKKVKLKEINKKVKLKGKMKIISYFQIFL